MTMRRRAALAALVPVMPGAPACAQPAASPSSSSPSSMPSPSPSSVSAQAAPPRTGWITDPRFNLAAFGPRHPEQPQRVQAIQAALASQPALEARLVKLALASDTAVDEAIARVHTRTHVEAIRTRYDADINAVARAAVAAVLAAVEAVHERRIVNAFVASRPPGHHARNTGREEGFCFFNHVAVAARHVQRKLGHARVLIVDWDYHHGDGTEALFYDDPSVFYFSTHDPLAYPRTGDPARTGAAAGLGFTSNNSLACGNGSAEVLAIYRDRLIPIADRFNPDFVLVSCGFDSREDDLLGCLRINDDGYRRMTGIVTDIAARHCAGRLVSVLEGGYNIEGLARAAMAHTQGLVDAARSLRR